MHRLNWLFALLSGAFLTACGPDERPADALIDDLPKVELVCESVSVDPEAPRFSVSARLEESRVRLAEMASCGPIDPKEYAQLGIPANALTAVGGYWAGLGEYLYAAEEPDGRVVFYLGQLEEGEDSPRPSYVPLAAYQDARFQIIRPLNPADLAGIYAYEARDTAFVLFLGLRENTMEATLFYRPGALPPANTINQELPNFQMRPFREFMVSLNSLTFDSDLGPGLIAWTPDSSQLIFSRLLTPEGEPAVFRQVR